MGPQTPNGMSHGIAHKRLLIPSDTAGDITSYARGEPFTPWDPIHFLGCPRAWILGWPWTNYDISHLASLICTAVVVSLGFLSYIKWFDTLCQGVPLSLLTFIVNPCDMDGKKRGR